MALIFLDSMNLTKEDITKWKESKMEDLTVIAQDGERWTRGTLNGAKGLADYLTFKGNPAKVYSTSGLEAGGTEKECLMHVGKVEDDLRPVTMVRSMNEGAD